MKSNWIYLTSWVLSLAAPDLTGATDCSHPGTSLFFTRVYAKPTLNDAVELYNPSQQPIDFSGFLFSDGENHDVIGIPGNVWSVIQPGGRRVLRRGETGSFTFGLDYDDVLYLYDRDTCRVEQIAWYRDDLAWPDLCQTRVPETGGLHTGIDWISSGGLVNMFAGEVRYMTCPDDMLGPPISVLDPQAPTQLDWSIFPNPVRTSTSAVVRFVVPHADAFHEVTAQIELFSASGQRLSAQPLPHLSPGPQTVRLESIANLSPGAYLLRLRVGGREGSRFFVVVG